MRCKTYFLLVAPLAILSYYPSLFHIARSDHLAYLADMAGVHDWFTLAVKSYAFNRQRLFVPGDEMLFRPLLYFILGTETWLFGHRFICWQAVGILLHLGVLWWLLKLLLHLGLRSTAVLLTCWMACLLPVMELVIWHHLDAYLVFGILTLAALFHVHKHVQEGQSSSSPLLKTVCLLFAASLIHERLRELSALRRAISDSASGKLLVTAMCNPVDLCRWSAIYVSIPPRCLAASLMHLRGATAPPKFRESW